MLICATAATPGAVGLLPLFIAFAKIGAVLDSGAHKAFVERLGSARALYLIYSGLLISGKEAADWGLVSRSVPPADLQAEARALLVPVSGWLTEGFATMDRQEAKALLDARRGAPRP